MQQEKRKGPLVPLNLQLFASDGAGDGGDGANDGTNNGGNNNNNNDTPKNKHSDEDYDKLKASHDKISSEIAELKKQLRSKQTDEEKKAEEEKVKNQEIEAMKKDLATYKIKAELGDTFETDEIEKLSKVLVEGNQEEIVKTLKEIVKAKKEKIYADAKKEFSQSSSLPGGNGKDDVPSNVQSYIDGKKSKGKTAKDYFFGGNKSSQAN